MWLKQREHTERGKRQGPTGIKGPDQECLMDFNSKRNEEPL